MITAAARQAACEGAWRGPPTVALE